MRLFFINILLLFSVLFQAQEKDINRNDLVRNYKFDCSTPCLKDSSFVSLCDDASWKLKSYDIDSALYFALRGLNFAKNISWNKGIAKLSVQTAICYKYLSLRDSAFFHLQQAAVYYNKYYNESPSNLKRTCEGVIRIYYQLAAINSQLNKKYLAVQQYKIALRLATLIQDKRLIGGSHGNLSIEYNAMGDYSKAIEENYKAIAIFDQLNEERSSMSCMHTMGGIYNAQGQALKAKECFLDALRRARKMNDVRAEADIFYSLAEAYIGLKQTDSALYYHKESMRICIQSNDEFTILFSYNGLANLFCELRLYDSSNVYALKGLKLSKEKGTLSDVVSFKLYLAKNFYKLGQNTKANTLLEEIIPQAFVVPEKPWQLSFHNFCYEFYKAIGKPEKAFTHFRTYKFYNDSLYNDENSKSLMQSEINYEYTKRALTDSLNAQKERNVLNAQLDQQKSQRNFLYSGIALVLVFSIFMVNRFRVTSKQSKIISHKMQEAEEQKILIEEKQREILDSIHYAKRIQSALMNTERSIWRQLQQSMKGGKS